MSAFEHGSRRGYTYYKCRCVTCRTANSAYKVRYRLSCRAQHALYPELTPHGKTVGYDDYGCRCGPCVKAGKARKR